MRKNDWIKSPWTVSIGTAIFSLFLTIGYDYSKNKPILSTILEILKIFWNFIILVLNLNIKVWWLMVGIIVIIVVVYLFINFKQEEILKPDFYSYREDKFKIWRWSWNWKLDYYKKAWCVSNLTAHCPNCDTPMMENYSIYGLTFDCPRCDFRARDSYCEEPQKIERIILDNIERKRRNKGV